MNYGIYRAQFLCDSTPSAESRAAMPPVLVASDSHVSFAARALAPRQRRVRCIEDAISSGEGIATILIEGQNAE